MAKQKQESLGNVIVKWASSPFIFGADSKEARENEAHHPSVNLTDRGIFVDDRGVRLDPKDIPDHIKAAATKISFTPAQARRQELTMRDAMLNAGVPDTEPDPEVRRPRGRPRKQAVA